MKSLLAFGALLAAVIQLFNYLFIKSKYKNFLSVKGKIIKCKLDDFSNPDGSREFKANIEIEYEYQSKTYQCSTPVLRSFELFPAYQVEANLAGKHKEGDIVDVKFDVNKPSRGYISIAPLSIISSLLLVTSASVASAYLYYVKFILG